MRAVKTGIAGVLFIILAGCGGGNNAAPPAAATTDDAPAAKGKFSEHEFTAKVSKVRLQSKLIEAGKTNDDSVTVKVQAILYPKPIVIADARKATTDDLPEEVKFLVDYTVANLEGSAEDIAAFWAPSVRAEKLAMITKYHAKNRELTAKSPGLTVVAIVKHGTESVSVIRQMTEKMVVGVTLIKKEGRLLLINQPKNDLELAIIEASLGG